MTDRGKFEQLANAILRKAEVTYRAIIEFGINAQGETIGGPNDGFCMVPMSDPPHFVWIQHTTTDKNSLKAKWLSENPDHLGDLIKTATSADEWRASFPNAKFTVVLSTNQRPEEDLTIQIARKAQELGLGLPDVRTQSYYADFLDNDRDGQYLRKIYLGTDAQILSVDLLKEICEKSLNDYKRTFHISQPEDWVSREQDDVLSNKTHLESGVTFLVGESGFGKSVLSCRCLETHIRAGRFGLYIPQNIIQTSINLSDAIGQTLEKLYPTLLRGEEKTIPSFLQDKQFVIAVDDVNRTENPSLLIERLAGWVEKPYLVICPVWPRYWNLTQELSKKEDIQVVQVDKMTSEEAWNTIQKVVSCAGLSRLDAEKILFKLDRDPFLIGVLGQLIKQNDGVSVDSLIENTILTYTNQQIYKAIEKSRTRFFEHEYREAFVTLAENMLVHKNLYPYWWEIQAWLEISPQKCNIIRELAEGRNLCYVTPDGKFSFKHDRILEYFCVEALGKLLNSPSQNQDVLFEPYYAEIVGKTLLRFPQEETVLNILYDKAPLALISTIKHIAFPLTEYYQMVIGKAKGWVQFYAAYRNSFPESVRGAIAMSLLQTDSPAVLQILDTNTTFGLEKHWLGGLARFRNGDARGALNYCSIMGFGLDFDGYLFLELVEHAKLNHRDKLIQDLNELLRNPKSQDEITGSPMLAGFLGLQELQNALVAWWNDLQEKSKHLAKALWAALRCTENLQQEHFLDDLIDCWATLPDKNGYPSSKQQRWYVKSCVKSAREQYP
jgi:hypothetical protein